MLTYSIESYLQPETAACHTGNPLDDCQISVFTEGTVAVSLPFPVIHLHC